MYDHFNRRRTSIIGQCIELNGFVTSPCRQSSRQCLKEQSFSTTFIVICYPVIQTKAKTKAKRETVKSHHYDEIDPVFHFSFVICSIFLFDRSHLNIVLKRKINEKKTQ